MGFTFFLTLITFPVLDYFSPPPFSHWLFFPRKSFVVVVQSLTHVVTCFCGGNLNLNGDPKGDPRNRDPGGDAGSSIFFFF